ncbi:MAG: hypothetical protein GXO28_01255 [Methanopyri archaeon]|nr:hypothetical protein [Methanopyri archaeon]
MILRPLTRRKDITEEDLQEMYAEDPEVVLKVKRWILKSYAYDRDIVRYLADLLDVDEDRVLTALSKARSCTALYGLHCEVEQARRIVDAFDDDVLKALVLLDVISEGELSRILGVELLDLRDRGPIEIDREFLIRFLNRLQRKGVI